MASASNMDINLFGWELTYTSVKNDIKNKEDMVIVLLHWALIKANFRCVGIGESMEESDSDVPSEILPQGWNIAENYALRYIYNQKLYNFAAVKNSNGIIIINVLHKGQKISSFDVNLDQTIHSLNGPMNEILPNYKEFFTNLQKQLITSIVDSISSHQSTQTSVEPNRERRSEPFPPLYEPPRRTPWENDPLADPRQVGRADLDPFGRGGGMLFNPPFPSGSFSGSNFPGVAPNSVPPGARFDPFRPPGTNPMPGPHRPPDSDHFPPPGYDDMFM